MEAPERIYIPTILAANTVRYKEEGSIEYVRTDAFIEKACEWLSKHAKKYYFNKDGHYLGTDELVEDFKLSMLMNLENI